MDSTEFFKSLNHRKILTDLVDEAPVIKKRRVNFSVLAEALGIQKTYVSRVMANQACWSSDQVFLIAQFFRLSEEQAEYFGLLIEIERTGLEKRRQQLQVRVKALRRKHLRSEKSVAGSAKIESPDSPAKTAYFADPYHSLVHVYLSLPKYQKHMQSLADDIGLTFSHLQTLLRRLEELGVISYNADRDEIILRESRIHSPSGSPEVFAHQQLFRALSFDRMHRCPADRRNGFNVVFSGDSHLQESVWAEFLEFLKKAEALTRTSKSTKEIFYLQFDLFPWTIGKSGEAV
ncbi:MAG: DUF4423 domain-containing protein [Pseudobdellovibrionaceae bacterium]